MYEPFIYGVIMVVLRIFISNPLLKKIKIKTKSHSKHKLFNLSKIMYVAASGANYTVVTGGQGSKMVVVNQFVNAAFCCIASNVIIAQS